MTLTIIGIHGLANKPEPDTLKDYWEKSIREGLKKNEKIPDADIDFKMVYWANLLYKNTLHRDSAFDFDDLFNDESYKPAAPGALKLYKDNWKDDVRRIGQSIIGKTFDEVKSTFNLNLTAGGILKKHLKDLAFYYDRKRKIRDRKGKMRHARQVLMDELETEIRAAKGKRIMVIAHSMGTIIAYDVLRNIGRSDDSFDVDYFLTIGSPLGLPHVKANIYEERKAYAKKGKQPERTPTIVKENWINYADRLDVVALDSHLSDDFDSNDSGVQVVDDLILNDYVRKNGKPNHHKSYGYLRTPELSKFVAHAL